MRILNYDCFAGISGDMNLGAMLDLGVDLETLSDELLKLGLSGWSLEAVRDARGGISGTRAIVNIDTDTTHGVHCENSSNHLHEHSEAGSHEHSHVQTHSHIHEHRSFADIKKIIANSALSASVKERSLKIFSELAAAEASVHGVPPDEVNFHEVGAVDSIVDIVGCAICLDILKVDAVVSSPVELGSGTVRCAHGILPVPAPATVLLARKFPSKLNGAPHECTTPTGAAIIATLASEFSPKISGRLLSVGVGIGSRDFSELPNVLRVSLYEADSSAIVASGDVSAETLAEYAANIDDMSPEALSLLCEKLFDAGALDVWQESVAMKKGRLGVKVCSLVRRADADKIVSAYFVHSSSLGIRMRDVSRLSLRRENFSVDTPYGSVHAKRSFFRDCSRVKFEFDDIKKISSDTKESMESIVKKIDDGAKK